MPLAVGPLFICDQVILENMSDDCIGYTKFHNLARNTKLHQFLVHRNQASFLPIGKGFSEVAQNGNRPVKGGTMEGSANFNNFGGMSSGPADLFGLIAFTVVCAGPNPRRR